MFMNSKQLMDYACMSRSKLDKLIAEDRIPRVKIGRRWLFDEAEIDEWIRSGKAADKDWRYNHEN